MLPLALLLTALATTQTSSLTLPQTAPNDPTTGGVTPPFPPSVPVTFYRNSDPSNSYACTMEISTGTLEAEVCTAIGAGGISIAQVPGNDCTFTVFTGSVACEVEEGGGKDVRFITAEAGEVCFGVGVGVGDGEAASGVWSCG